MIREKALDAIDLLNDLIVDFVTGTTVLTDYNKKYRTGAITIDQMSGVQKMCLSHIVLGLSKLHEFWERYHDIVPEQHRSDLKTLNKSLVQKGVTKFRNKVAGHIWDKKLMRIRRHSEIMNDLETLTDGNAHEFLAWVNNPKANSYPNTVVSIILAIRNSLVEMYTITPNEVIGR